MIAEEIHKTMVRKHAAQSALKFFTDIKKIESPNLKSSPSFRSFKAYMTIHSYRAMNDKLVITQSAADAAKTGVGCCGEKMSICYTSLASNPVLLGNSSVIICTSDTYEHAVIVVTDLDIGDKNLFYMSELSNTTMIVDGWTEDWYFPNLSNYDTFINHLLNIPTATQYRIRNEIKGHELKTINHPLFYPKKD
jgi:hypothetical protein